MQEDEVGEYNLEMSENFSNQKILDLPVQNFNQYLNEDNILSAISP